MFDRAQLMEQEEAAHQPESLQTAPQIFSQQSAQPAAGAAIQLRTSGKLNARQVRQLQARSGNRMVGRFLQGRVSGLPERLKQGVEALSGLVMDDVRVHYNSPKPAELQALAYTQGNQIYVGPGQEKHLPHEAWHVVQQKLGRVRPTMQIDGVAVNADLRLEQEAHNMGTTAAQMATQPQKSPYRWTQINSGQNGRRHISLQERGLAVGGADIAPTSDNAVQLTNLRVEAGSRGSGGGQEIIKRAEDAAHSMGRGIIRLESQDNGSGRLTSWYEEQGFKKRGTGPHGFTLLEKPVNFYGAPIQRMDDIALTPDEQSNIARSGLNIGPANPRSYGSLISTGTIDYLRQVSSGARRMGRLMGGEGPEFRMQARAENQRAYALIKEVILSPQMKYRQVSSTVMGYLQQLERFEAEQDESSRVQREEVIQDTIKTGVTSKVGGMLVRAAAVSVVATPITNLLFKKYFAPIENQFVRFATRKSVQKLVVAPVIAIPLSATEFFGSVEEAFEKSKQLQESHPILHAELRADNNDLFAPYILPILEEYDRLAKEKRDQVRVEVIEGGK